jgi:D-cysteine desulfhydrase family pyridoxal phosphate-dependent enzyme
MRLEDIPRVQLVHEPTPLHLLPRLSASLGGVQVWCKRDDLTRLALGGNKLRKLEFLLRDALEQGADTIITTGAAQSNHARLTAAAASSLGLRAVLVLGGPVVGQGQGNLLLDDLMGAEVRFHSWQTWDEASAILEDVAAELRATGRRPYIIPMGGTNALGVLGYVLAAREIAGQTEDHPPEAVICATSSGGTQAGLVLGKVFFDLPFEVVGISVSEPAAPMAAKVARFANEAAALIGAAPVPPAAINVLDDYIGAGYGRLDKRTSEAIRTVASLDGVLLDPVYTGKAMAGLLDLAHQGRWKAGQSIVFLHTGGIPALFAYWDALSNRP